MEGKLLFIITAILVKAIVAHPPHSRKNPHLRPNLNSNGCHSRKVEIVIQRLKADIHNIKQNLRCRMDPGACSESVLKTSSEDQMYFDICNVCNGNFSNYFLSDLRQFYMTVTIIRGHIETLQLDLTLSNDDPLSNLTNTLSNNIRDALQASQPNIALPLSSPNLNDVTGESGLLMELITTVNTIGSFLNVASHMIKT